MSTLPYDRTSLAFAAVAVVVAVLAVAGCGSSTPGTQTTAGTVARGTPQVLEPAAGGQPGAGGGAPPVGDPNSHAPPLTEIRHELKLELVAAAKTNASYIDPLQFVTAWGRTDQGVDASMPVGAPILAPCRIKILAITPGWYAGQPLVYFELLDGADAGRVQYVAEQITEVAPAGTILQREQPIARYAQSGTEIEYGWSTPSGVTLAVATTGYEEGEVTPAGRAMRSWLNSLGANAGSS